jgi:hypothetical protein
VILAADGGEMTTDPILKVLAWKPCEKFQPVLKPNGICLAWGYAGRGEGDQFGEWFDDLLVESWGQVEQEVTQKTIQVNSALLDPTNPDKGTIASDRMSQVNLLLAGSVKGEFRVLGIDPEGRIRNPVGTAVFIGIGADEFAIPSWRDAIRSSQIESVLLLRSILDPLVESAVYLRSPLRIWSCTATAMTEI